MTDPSRHISRAREAGRAPAGEAGRDCARSRALALVQRIRQRTNGASFKMGSDIAALAEALEFELVDPS